MADTGEATARLRGRILTLLESEEERAFWDHAMAARYLRARSGNEEKALAMATNSIAWRREYRPDLITFADVEPVASLGSTVLLDRPDRLGRPVVFIRPGTKNPFPAADRIRLVVWLMEHAIRRMEERGTGADKLLWLVDFSSYGDREKDGERRETSKATLHIFQSHYPERLGHGILMSPPWFLSILFKLVRPFMARETREKFEVLSGDQDQLRKRLGELLNCDQVDFCMRGGVGLQEPSAAKEDAEPAYSSESDGASDDDQFVDAVSAV